MGRPATRHEPGDLPIHKKSDLSFGKKVRAFDNIIQITLKDSVLKTIVFMLSFALSYRGHAQERYDSATQLREVVVEQSRLGSYAISKYTLTVDSLTHELAGASSLADLMRKYGYGHLRGYGPGGLATASFRGTGSSHTAVLWNGINLTSPLSGQLDLSHIPVTFIDDISIQTGGAASLYGNGSIGATIQLNNQASFNEGLGLTSRSSAGSFGTWYQDLGAAWSGSKFITSTKVFISEADNDFPYLSNAVFPVRKEKRDHTAVSQKGLLHQDYWQVAPSHLLTFKLWLQDDSYEVPNPSTVLRKAEAVEKNTFYRSLLGWHFTHRWLELNYQGAFMRHDLDFTDPAANIDGLSRFNTTIQSLEGNFTLHPKAMMTSGLNYTWEEGLVDEFGNETPRRNRMAFFAAFKWSPLRKWEIAAALREELVNGRTTPTAPSATVRFKATPAWEIYTTASRNYRIPTFNDLYWRGAGALGNPDLRAETSLSQEAGVQYTTPYSSKTRSLSFKAAAFSSKVKDWMQWTPVSASIWSPVNLRKVWSRGIEAQTSAKAAVAMTTLELQLQYVFTRSTNESIYDNLTSNELDQQLTFTPQHEGSATARAHWRKYTVNAIASYTGKQYTDGDNTNANALKAYAFVNLWLSRSITWKHLNASLMGELNNLFDTAYQSRPGYPMPGRNYRLTLTLKFNKPKSI
jgi:vitamin B12 transporter